MNPVVRRLLLGGSFVAGVLLVGVGNCTRLLRFLTDLGKTYRGQVRFGSTTELRRLPGSTPPAAMAAAVGGRVGSGSGSGSAACAANAPASNGVSSRNLISPAMPCPNSA